MDDATIQRGLLREGIAVGLAGAFVVAVWFLVVDLVNGTPFQTPAALGSAVFLGIQSSEGVEVSLRTVGLYTIFHGVIYSMVGLAGSALMRAADNAPSFVGLIILSAVVLEAAFLAFVATLAQFLLAFLPWWSVLGGNVLAAAAMGVLLLRWHPATTAVLMRTDEAIPVN